MFRLLLILTSFLSLNAFAEKIDLSSIQSSSVEWLAVGNPGFLKIESKSQTLSGTMNLENGEAWGTFITDLDKLSTGIKLRDEHVKDNYLEIKKYPEAKFTLNKVKVTTTFEASGIMSLHGVDRDVKWSCQSAKSSEIRKISCVSKISLTDFNMKIPSYLGVTVAKDVKLKVTFVI